VVPGGVRGHAGSVAPVLLLHGLAGHAGEWNSTVAWLGDHRRVVALDDLADAEPALEALGEPAVVVGQSLGGLIAIRLAAARPDLVLALVVAEASPSAPEDPDAFAAEVGAKLDAWAARLRESEGYWPSFDVDAEVRMLRDAVAESAWPEWERLRCPVLVVRGERGLPAEEAEAMARRGHDVRVAVVPDAGHDVHLDQPEEWRVVVGEFLASLESRRA
jgi:pimeloyl-ACP methyl ester carboxylesterase